MAEEKKFLLLLGHATEKPMSGIYYALGMAVAQSASRKGWLQ
jgi:hypothetical protein